MSHSPMTILGIHRLRRVRMLAAMLLVFGGTAAADMLSSAAGDSVNVQADSLIKTGIRLHSEARYSEAIAVFLKAGADSGSAAARFYLGLSYSGLNEFREAAKQIATAVRMDSQNVGYRFRLAVTFGQLGETARAQEQYELLLRQDHAFAPALFNLGMLLQEQREYRRSAEMFLQVILRRPTDFLSYYDLGVSLAAMEQPDSARVCFATSMTLNPSYVPAISNLASYHYDRKNFDEALRLYRRCAALRPTSPDIAFRVGLCYQQMQLWNPAKSSFQSAIALSPTRSDYVAQLGYAYFFTRQYDSCSIAYQKAIAIDSTNSFYHLNLALAYASLDSTALAEREFQKAIDLRHPEELAKVYNQLAGLCFRTGQFRKAITSYQKALEADPHNRESRFYLSITFERLAELRNARQSFEKFLTIAPSDTSMSDWKKYAKERIRAIDKRPGK